MFFPTDDEAPFEFENRMAHDEDEGSAFRYYERVDAFRRDGDPYPEARHAAFWFLHNAVVHPLLGVCPNDKTVALHDLTSQWLNKTEPKGVTRRRTTLDVTVPTITSQAIWVLHNCVAHPLIGVVPSKLAFDLHDWTARLMKVPGWV